MATRQHEGSENDKEAINMQPPRQLRCALIAWGAALLIGIGALGEPASAAPEIVNGRNFAGQFDPQNRPWASGAVGPTRYIQFVDQKFAIYTRANTGTAPISAGTLNDFTGIAPTGGSYQAQAIWDPTTSRFYYLMSSVFGSGDYRLSYGWSNGPSPRSPADFCHFSIGYGAAVPSSPKLGDNGKFLIIGFNLYRSGMFEDAQLLIFNKPSPASACTSGPAFGTALRDSANNKVFSPTPANGVDTWEWGYVVARSFTLPSNQLWLFGVAGQDGGVPTYGPPKAVNLPFAYEAPPSAYQRAEAFNLYTGDGSLSQAVIARNPDRGNAYSLWTQHTIRDGSFAAIRWYEINPFTRPARLLRNGLITAAGAGLHVFNGAISPDRRVDGTTARFGDSFVVQFNRSGTVGRRVTLPEIRMGSSFSGGPLSFGTVTGGQGSYSDPTCEFAGNTCLWPTTSACSPDPRPVTTARGTVWCTNVFAGPGGAQYNWRSQIFAVRP